MEFYSVIQATLRQLIIIILITKNICFYVCYTFATHFHYSKPTLLFVGECASAKSYWRNECRKKSRVQITLKDVGKSFMIDRNRVIVSLDPARVDFKNPRIRRLHFAAPQSITRELYVESIAFFLAFIFSQYKQQSVSLKCVH